MLPPLTRPSRYRSLDLWRGVACLSVVIYHAGFALELTDLDGVGAGPARWMRLACMGALRMMYVGVPIFFVISGYCIAASADSTRRKGDSPWTFLKRRFWRIYPPYWASLVGLIALVAILDATGLTRFYTTVAHQLTLRSPADLSWIQWLGNFTLTETWRGNVWGMERPGWGEDVFTRVAWTLCYEEQFYFLCFLVLAIAPRRLYRALGLVSVLIVGYRVWAWRAGWLDRIDGAFPVYWHEFAAGMAVYWRLTVARSALAKRAVEAMLVAMFGIGLLWGLRSTAGAGAFSLILIALRRWDNPLADASSHFLRGLHACGERCYSIYLVHLPVCTLTIVAFRELHLTGFWTRAFLVVPLVSLAATAAGWLFFDLVERRVHTPKSASHTQPSPSPATELALS
ncbi:acyltransferase [Singulisphaera sp. Ch08]|uniref:Acyltransferase n=1 Tax=Singulisphaera sp. Ch08 TaxID=3120278 RepID=A0AAU7CA77_9BACT